MADANKVVEKLTMMLANAQRELAIALAELDERPPLVIEEVSEE